MTNLKDQIQHGIRKERERSETGLQTAGKRVGDSGSRLDEIRSRLDELPHTTDKYTLKADIAAGPYSADIAIVELYDLNGVWAARWEIAPTVGESAEKWEVTCNPHGVDTQHEWFRDSDSLFEYLTASIVERVVEMDADRG